MELPLFPLHVVLFPGRTLPLHVFEPRYRRMLEDLTADGADGRFGVVAIRQGNEMGGGALLHSVGTVARLTDVRGLPDGRADITSRGEQRFRITGLVEDKPYPCAHVELLDDQAPGPRASELGAAVRRDLAPYLCALGAPPELMARLPHDPVELAYLAASSLQTEIPEQQRLLELDRVEERLEATLRMLRREQGIARHIGTVGSLRPVGPGGPQLN
jgi:Lon protease-like protein